MVLSIKEGEGAYLPSCLVVSYMDNGMDPLHFLTGLIRAKMELVSTI